ncbi:MAG: lipoate--protein ligase family protein [Thaumarchaeota archaeon]|nr:lipoate--protein ligase family protein [Nitrososphaerota archaeon]
MESRLIVDGATGAYANLALEEAILRENRALILRLWGNERSVIIGRAQLARFETDVDRCAREGVPIVRRVTAGGAIYNGPGNINWSLFVGREFSAGGIRYLWGVHDVFRMAADLVVRATAACGVETWLEEPNRILSAEGKVSGMAAYLSREGLLCHGTLLLNADLADASSLTQPAEVQLEKRYTRSRAMRIANTGIGSDAFIASMRGVVKEETGGEIEPGEPTEPERTRMASLMTRYSDPAWNLGDPFEGGPG